MSGRNDWRAGRDPGGTALAVRLDDRDDRLRWRIAVVSWLVAGVSFALLAIAGEFDVPALAAHESKLDAVLAIGLAGAAGAWMAARWRSDRARTAVLRLLLALVGIALSLVGAEAAVRFLFHDVRSSADVRSYFAARALPARINNVGFRDRDVGPKYPDRYRIAVIGDSITWGQG